ncbi:MAG: sulfurtransferase FdhD [Rhodobacterales bacterium]|nr:MAG: sulfurtransferase FdhD [Rhodobacterales bacterium]PIE09191.1 MAG: sulfurtransferase FdhD [Rhodobacterales bacterium]
MNNENPLQPPLEMRQIRLGTGVVREAVLAEETAVAVTVNGSTMAVLMATPRDLTDFATGFLLTEGIIAGAGEIDGPEVVEHPNGLELRVWLEGLPAEVFAARQRRLTGGVGCGLCGIDSLSEAARDLPDQSAFLPRMNLDALRGAMTEMRARQELHQETRAVHAAGFFDAKHGLMAVREDVGRHNALDKTIGHMARHSAPMRTGAVLLTSRISVEMVQKSAMARAPVIASVSAPTAHAARLAQSAGISIVQLAGDQEIRIFSCPERFD